MRFWLSMEIQKRINSVIMDIHNSIAEPHGQSQHCAVQTPDKLFHIVTHGCAFFVKVRWEFQDFENRPSLCYQFLVHFAKALFGDVQFP